MVCYLLSSFLQQFLSMISSFILFHAVDNPHDPSIVQTASAFMNTYVGKTKNLMHQSNQVILLNINVKRE